MTQTDDALGHVVIVDDDFFDLKMYRRIIDRSGMVGHLVTFTSAKDALDYIADPGTPSIDLLFLDINMPVMNGFEFMDEACRIYGPDFEVPVIMMLTTSISPDDKARAATYAPIREYFNKPITVEHLQRAENMLRQAKA